MPYSRSSKRFTGFLSIEEVEGSENFTRRFFQLNKANSQLEYYADDPSQVCYCFCISSSSSNTVGSVTVPVCGYWIIIGLLLLDNYE